MSDKKGMLSPVKGEIMGGEKIRRKTYIVNRPMQFQLIGIFVFSVVLSLIIFTAGTSIIYWVSGMTGEYRFKEYMTIYRQVTEVQEIETDGEIVRKEISTTKEIPGVKRWEIVIPALVINNLILLVLILIVGVVYSHRLAGPLYRIQTDLDKVLQGARGCESPSATGIN